MEEQQSKKIIEVNGIKMEVDLRTAKIATVETFKVGDNVRVLVKSRYGDSSFESFPGVIINFTPFRNRPTITVAYVSRDFDGQIHFVEITPDSKDTEIAYVDKKEFLSLDREYVLDLMNRKIAKKEMEIEEIKEKRKFFVKEFGNYFKAEEEEKTA